MKYIKLFNREVKPYKNIWFLLGLVALFTLLRIPSLIEPYWYGDEGIYQVIGKALNSGRVLYQDIWDNKPPLLYYIYAIFNGEQFMVRVFSLLIGIFSVISFYFLGKKLFKKRSSVLVATFTYVILFATPLIEGNIANAENFMHLPILLCAIFILKSIDEKKAKFSLIAGGLMSVAFILKIVAVFEFTAFMLFLLFVNRSRITINLSILSLDKFKREILFFIGFLSLPFLFSIYFFLIGAFPDFVSGVLSENIDYVGVGNNFIFPMGILFLKIILAVVLIGFVLIKRRSFYNYNLLLYLWLIMALFSTFFSQRPYLHYILMSSLPFSYFIGSIFEEKNNRLVKTAVAFIVIIVVYFNFGYYKKTISYYQNYISFVFYDKPIEKYQSFFDPNTPRDYEVARFIEMFSEKQEDVFLWSDSGQIYALSDTLPPGKYIVAYHITYYNDAISYMVEEVNKKNPRYIIQTKESPEFRNFLPSYVLKYKFADSYIYEREG